MFLTTIDWLLLKKHVSEILIGYSVVSLRSANLKAQIKWKTTSCVPRKTCEIFPESVEMKNITKQKTSSQQIQQTKFIHDA